MALLIVQAAHGQLRPEAGRWHLTLSRPGGLPVYLTMQLGFAHGEGSPTIQLINAADTVAATEVQLSGDSLFFQAPVFESVFGLRLTSSHLMQGQWLKGTAAGTSTWSVVARRTDEEARIPGPPARPLRQISGRWSMYFVRRDGSVRQSVGILQQQRNRVTGTILNASGDYRFLEGAVRGDSLYLTTFDGAHSYALVAHLPNDSTMQQGLFFGGTPPGEAFSAVRNAHAELPESVRPAPQPVPVSFRFPDLDGKPISLADKRFAGKVVLVQLMGSWCPNCMDETQYLSQLYNSNAWPGVEVVALAYELSTDTQRSAASLRRFQQRFGVRYPMLITGVTSSDPDKSAKTLPGLPEIRFFPSLLFVDKAGRLRAMHEGFFGPGAPQEHARAKAEIENLLRDLLAE